MFQRATLPESTVHFLLSSPRRRNTIRYLQARPGTVSLRELSEAVAEIETGESPPPRTVRETVYISLLQSHLPALVEEGIIAFDDETKEIRASSRTREIQLYLEVVTPYGITWAEYYRYLGIVGLLIVVGSLTELPVVSAIDPLLSTSAFLGLFAISTAFQLWKDRYSVLRQYRE